jgi:Na+/H+ antiporter NhaD/arsenite permease-like protein
MNHLAIYAVFILTYLLIASRRLSLIPIGRPAGALLGAVLMVVFGALTPSETYQAVDHDTIVLLFGTMVLTVYLERARFFDWVAHGALSVCRTPARLLWATALLSGGLSSLLVNDTVCLFLTPVVISACNRAGLPLGPYLIALATSANIGSAATLVGNPQNMIIGSMSGLAFSRFIGLAGPAAGIGLFLNGLLLWIFYGGNLPERMGDDTVGGTPQRSDNLWLVIMVTAGVIGGFFMGFHLGYTTLAGVMVLILADRKDPRDIFGRVDWALLLFFCSLFIVVAGLAKTGLVERCWSASAEYLSLRDTRGIALFSTLMTVGSNLVSNVPMVLLTGPHMGQFGQTDLGWVLLAFTTTVAGNFTLIGSVANIIVAERARDHYRLGFFEYLRFGLVSTVLVMIAGVATIVYFRS